MGLFNRKFKRSTVDLAALQRDLEIVNDCARLMETTVNPDTFFSRYDLYMQKLSLLANAEATGAVKVSGDSMIQKLNIMSTKEQEIDIITDFIDRMWKDTCIKADSLKTASGRKSRYQKFMDALQKYEYHMPPQCIDYYKNVTHNAISLPEYDNKINCIDTNDTSDIIFPDWYVSISFGKSSSDNYMKAVTLAKAAPQYHEQIDAGKILHQAIYSANPREYLAFIMLYELVGKWKSAFVIINGQLVDRKIVGNLNYCYGDRCRSGNPKFCFGASYMTENPFGCHRLQISACNHPWWTFYRRSGLKWILDTDTMLQQINSYAHIYSLCPVFNYDSIIKEVYNLPQTLSDRQYSQLIKAIEDRTTLHINIKI